MTRTRDNIISASRRTDIPAWYTPWFLEQIRQKQFITVNPFTRKPKQVDVRPENTHSIVFWSKNYGPFLDLDAHKILGDMGFSLFFNFTVNSESLLLEPGLPGLDTRIAQAGMLADRFGPEAVAWRFDPICFYTRGTRSVENNLSDFLFIADAMADLGITVCVTSFYDAYRKVGIRTRHLAETGGPLICFTDPDPADKQLLLCDMAKQLEQKRIRLHLCCEKNLFDKAKPGCANIFENACINGPFLEKLYGGSPDTRRDSGQRAKKGCRCTRSIDIGSYQDHPCYHNCLFCYAHTEMDTRIKQGRLQ
ncbi:MAG TPA: DUF1848 family protein [Desulfotignum sp.]|nr:DUF1848 family protein [Desulfotignum sp.]